MIKPRSLWWVRLLQACDAYSKRRWRPPWPLPAMRVQGRWCPWWW
ncbi:MAG: hypothetical protein NT169_02135 [Chloroflexi bacterium]|nr:hypothetical protein [Chloroflexota bacterium]